MFLGAAGAQLVRKLCLMVRTHVNICGNDKRLKHRTSPSSKTHAVLFEFMRKASAYLIFNWRRGWDSNPRFLAESLVFKTSSLNHSDTSPDVRWLARSYQNQLYYYSIDTPICQLFFYFFKKRKKNRKKVKIKKNFAEIIKQQAGNCLFCNFRLAVLIGGCLSNISRRPVKHRNLFPPYEPLQLLRRRKRKSYHHQSDPCTEPSCRHLQSFLPECW